MYPADLVRTQHRQTILTISHSTAVNTGITTRITGQRASAPGIHSYT